MFDKRLSIFIVHLLEAIFNRAIPLRLSA